MDKDTEWHSWPEEKPPIERMRIEVEMTSGHRVTLNYRSDSPLWCSCGVKKWREVPVADTTI